MRAAQSARKPRQPPPPPTPRAVRRISLAAIRLPEVSPSRLAGRLLALRDGEIDPDMPTEETAPSCLDRVEQDRPGYEIDLVALLVVGDDQVEVFVVVDSAGERVALAYRTSDCMLIAER